VDRFELAEVQLILQPAREALEADEAGQSGDGCLLTVDFEVLGGLGDGVIVQRREPSAHDVDDAVATVDAQVVGVGDILGREDLAVSQPPGVDALQEAQPAASVLGPSGTSRSLSLVART
jgi:hypothetical protein